ncbi:MAG: hypothetical protein U9R19_14655 [Bacteroidota bacterium]|nr:hypothetical protein [Bacteroidota bacterium]
MIINIETKINIEVDNCNLKTLTLAFLIALKPLFKSFVTQALLHFYYESLASGKLCRQLQTNKIIQKSHSKPTKLKTIFGDIWVPQIQVRIYQNNIVMQRSITRLLLGVEPRYQIPGFMKELLGLLGSLTTYRVGHKILKMFSGFNCSLMSIWHSVQWLGKRINLSLAKDGINEFEADGTGIPTRNSGKRGSELKIVFQRNKKGKLHLVGIAIGKYKEASNWLQAMGNAIKEGITQFGKLILASDCDSTITETALQCDDKVVLQRDLWHVFHQLKYYLWQDKVEKSIRNNIISLVYKLMLIKKQFTVEHRLQLVGIVIESLIQNGYTHTATYLKTCTENFYTYKKEKNTNIYTSKTERSMRTINARINVGVWSDDGALNAIKIRLSYYYNGFGMPDWEKRDKVA